MNCRIQTVMLLAAGLLLAASPKAALANHLGAGTGHPTYPTIETEDIKNTLHNLGDTIAGFDNPNIVATGVREVCVYCHTPHGADAANTSAPLWNRGLPVGTSFTSYSAPNFDAAVGNPQGVSLACLSCHDGTIALDALRNGPGSGQFGDGTTSLNTINPQGATVLLNADGSFQEGTRATGTFTNYDAFLAPGTGGGPFPNLGIDLRDDHPISFLMPAVAVDPQFNVTKTASGGLNLINRGAGSGVPTDKRDTVRLYPNPATPAVPSDYVECASCHNPHAPRPVFLRLPSGPGVSAATNATVIPASYGGDGTTTWGMEPNRGSAICITCHQK